MCRLNETEKLQQQTWNFKFKHPMVQKHFQQYWQEFSSPLCCQRHGMHVHYLTPLKRVYSQLCLYSSHVNQPPFYALNCYSSTVAEGISPTSLLTWSVHPFSHFYREKTIVFLYKKILFVLVLQSCFSSWQWNPVQKVSVWFTIIHCGCEWQNSAKKEFSLQNCSVLAQGVWKRAAVSLKHPI